MTPKLTIHLPIENSDHPEIYFSETLDKAFNSS